MKTSCGNRRILGMPLRMSRAWLHRGDHVDVVEEVDVDLQVESLNKHLAVVNAELQVSRFDGDVSHIFLVKL